MSTTLKTPLAPRKSPRQARSQVTVEAIFDATVQVLLEHGPTRLTTTLVAGRAGVSVGSLYQYYPHKQALLYAVLERHLQRIGERVSKAAHEAHGKSLATMTSEVVSAFVRAKTEDVEESRALYAVAGQLEVQELIRQVEKRGVHAMAVMLATASDVTMADVDTAAWMLLCALTGPTRTVLEGAAPSKIEKNLEKHLTALCFGYLNAMKRGTQVRR